MRFELPCKIGARAGAQNAGRIDDATGQRREVDGVGRRRGEQRHQQRGGAHQNLTVGAVDAPSFASNDSRTFRSRYMIPCQMRPGNVRSSVLYCCTAAM